MNSFSVVTSLIYIYTEHIYTFLRNICMQESSEGINTRGRRKQGVRVGQGYILRGIMERILFFFSLKMLTFNANSVELFTKLTRRICPN